MILFQILTMKSTDGTNPADIEAKLLDQLS